MSKVISIFIYNIENLLYNFSIKNTFSNESKKIKKKKFKIYNRGNKFDLIKQVATPLPMPYPFHSGSYKLTGLSQTLSSLILYRLYFLC